MTAAATVLAVASASVLLSPAHRRAPHSRPGVASAAASRPVAPVGPNPTSAGVELTWRFGVGSVRGYDINRLVLSSAVQAADVTVRAANGVKQPKSVGEISLYSSGALDASELRSGTAVTVHGKAGYFGMFRGKPAFGWQYAANSWAVVTGDWGYQPATGTYALPIARAAEQSVADAVDTTRTDPFLVDFTLGWLPPGLASEQGVDVLGPNDTALVEIGFGDGTPRRAQGKATYGGSALTVSRQLAWHDNKPNMTVDGHPAYYDSHGLVMNLPDGTDLVIVLEQTTSKYTKADLVKIAHNASFGPKPADRATWVPAASALPH